MEQLTIDNFDESIASGVVLVDFWAQWCRPCLLLTPVLETVADEQPTTRVFKVNIDEQPELAKRYSVRSIPTMIIFKDGSESDRIVGLQSKLTITARIIKQQT